MNVSSVQSLMQMSTQRTILVVDYFQFYLLMFMFLWFQLNSRLIHNHHGRLYFNHKLFRTYSGMISVTFMFLLSDWIKALGLRPRDQLILKLIDPVC